MSMDLYVFYDGIVPDLHEWQKSIDSLQFDLTFFQDQTVAGEGAMIGAKWKGRTIHFECRPCEFDKLIMTYDDIEFGQRWKMVYAFYWSGLPECVAACIAAAALAHMHGGIVFDPQDSLLLRGDEVVHMARDAELMLKKLEAASRH